MKCLLALAILIALGLFGWGAYLYRVETRPITSIEVESPVRDLGERPVGKSQVVFRINNPTDHPTEFLSAPEGCGKLCCLKPITGERTVIPPGRSLDVVCELLVLAGAFEFSGNMFLNDNGLRAVKLTVRGVGVAPGAGDATPKK